MNLADIAREFGTDTNTVRAYFAADPEVTFGSDADELSEETIARLREGWSASEDSDASDGLDTDDDIDGDDVAATDGDTPVYAV